jgi:hypothetical protein
MCRGVALIATLAATELAAQEAAPLAAGSRVRVTAPELGLRNRQGTLVSTYGDTLFVRVAGSPLVAIPRDELTRLEVRAGPGPRPYSRDVALGIGLGVLAGALATATCTDAECPDHMLEYATGAGAVFGLGVGIAVGALSHTDRWEPVDRSRAFTLGLSLPTH